METTSSLYVYPESRVVDQSARRASAMLPAAKEKTAWPRELQYDRADTFTQDVGVFLPQGKSGTAETIERRGTFEPPKYYYRSIPQHKIR